MYVAAVFPIHVGVLRRWSLPVLLCRLRLPQLYAVAASLIGVGVLKRWSLPAAAAQATLIKHETVSVKSCTPIVCYEK